MIDKKRDVRVGLEQVSALRRCRGSGRGGECGIGAAAGIGAILAADIGATS